MTSTNEHISIRMPKALAEQLRAEAKKLERSLNWLIVSKLQQPKAFVIENIDVQEWERTMPRARMQLQTISREELQQIYPPAERKHAANCKCLMCKPPKP